MDKRMEAPGSYFCTSPSQKAGRWSKQPVTVPASGDTSDAVRSLLDGLRSQGIIADDDSSTSGADTSDEPEGE